MWCVNFANEQGIEAWEGEGGLCMVFTLEPPILYLEAATS